MNKKFTCSCFIRKNTKELTDKLEDLGYKKHFLHRDSEPYLHTWNGQNWEDSGYSSLPIDSCWNPDNENSCCDAIDCGENEQLFLALAALNDIDDYMQYFINVNGDFFLFFYENVKLCVNVAVKKATSEELIEHFKNN